MARVVVIGAGIGGLAVAARVAAQGHQVMVFEQAGAPGGKLAGITVDGFVFDTGPSLLTLPAVYRDLFLKTAVRRRNASLEDNVGLVGLDPAFSYQWADGTTAVLPGSNTNRVAGALQDALGGSAAADWRAFSSRAADIWTATRTAYLERPIDGPRDLLRQLGRVSDVRTVAPWKTLRGLGKQYLSDPRMRAMLDRYATYSGSDPRKSPAAMAVIPYVEQTFGAWHIEGGIHRLGRAVYDRCLERGVTFEFNADVTRIEVDASHVNGVWLSDGRRFDADAVVSDADAGQLYRELLPKQLSKPILRKLNRATPSFSGFALLLGIEGARAMLAHHNVLFPQEYDAEFDALLSATPVADPAIYVCAPNDSSMTPASGSQSWFVLVNAPRHDPASGMDWDGETRAKYANHILDVLATRGYDVRNQIRTRRVVTPADIERHTRSPGGAIYGTSSNGARAAFLRPGNRSPVAGLFLVGGSTHPGGGLPLVGMSAAIVAQLIGDA